MGILIVARQIARILYQTMNRLTLMYCPMNTLPIAICIDVGHVNNNSLLLLEFCKQTGLRITNRRVGNDSGICRYIFVGHRGCSVVDYVLGLQEIFSLVKFVRSAGAQYFLDHFFNFF